MVTFNRNRFSEYHMLFGLQMSIAALFQSKLLITDIIVYEQLELRENMVFIYIDSSTAHI
jgi:hypothetical protein